MAWEVDEVDTSLQPLEDARELAAVARQIVDAFEEDVLDTDPARVGLLRFLRKSSTRDKAWTFWTGIRLRRSSSKGRMEGQGEADRAPAEKLLQGRQEADGGERHLMRRKAEAPVRRQDLEAGEHVLEVVQRLAHAHIDDVSQVSLSGMPRTWARMPPALSWPWSPCLPVMQKRQPILQPT